MAIFLMLLVFANMLVWTSQVQEERLAVPQIVMARRTPGDDGPIIFGQDHKEDDGKEDQKSAPQQIPLDLIMQINSIENFTELLNFIDEESLSDYGKIDLANRFGEEDERKGAISPKPATCAPELITVPLQNPEDKHVFFYPACTRVERCGGCCAHDLLSCQPTASEMITYQVIRTEYEGGTKLSYKGKDYVTVEQHTKCKCDCKVKEEDCNRLQRYEKGECRCICLNVDEEQKCIAENETKLWDANECACSCRYTRECSTGFYFDQKTCNCSPVPVRRRKSDTIINLHQHEADDAQLIQKVMPRPVVPLTRVKDNEEGV